MQITDSGEIAYTQIFITDDEEERCVELRVKYKFTYFSLKFSKDPDDSYTQESYVEILSAKDSNGNDYTPYLSKSDIEEIESNVQHRVFFGRKQ